MLPKTFLRASRFASTSTSILRNTTTISSSLPNFHFTSPPFQFSPRFYAAPAPVTPKAVKAVIPRDEAIPHPFITIVDPESKTLLPPALLRDLLISLDRTKFFIQLVDPTHDPPVCKIMDKKEEFNKKRSSRASKSNLENKKEDSTGTTTSTTSTPTPSLKTPTGPPKEVHLTWGVTAHDLGHKLAKAKEFLLKGHRVIVVMNNKKGADTVDARGRSNVIEGVVEALEGHGKLVKPALNKGPQVMIEFKRE